MKIVKNTATKAYISDYTAEEYAVLEKACKYTNSSVAFQLRKHLKNSRFKHWCLNNDSNKWEKQKEDLEKEKDHSLLKQDDKGTYIYPGYIPYLPKKIEVDFEDNVSYPNFKMLPWRNKFPHELYTCQTDTIDLMLENKHCHAELATGIGKTITITTLAQMTGNTIIVTPGKDLFNDLVKNFKHYLGEKYVGYYGDGKKKLGKPITICIAKSLSMIKPGTDAWKFFNSANVVIGDECHTLAAKTLEATFHGVLANIPYRWFLSGTAIRGDGTGKLLKAIIGPSVYSFNTKQGIEAGILNHLQFKVVDVLTDKPGYYKDDPITMKRAHFLRNTNIADFYAKLANSLWESRQEQTLILVEEIGQIAELAKRLKVPFTYAHGNTTKKDDLERLNLQKSDNISNIEAFNKGEYKVFIGTNCVSTGTNFFSNHHTLNWQGGGSETSTKQGPIGRSVRLLHKSEYAELIKEKPITTVWDVNVVAIELMEKSLRKRIDFYKETGEPVKIIKRKLG